MIQIRCDDCEKPFEVSDEQAGQKVACPYCGDVNRVPQVAAPAGAATPVARPMGSAIESEPEQVIDVVRQAMFRAHPFWYSLMVFIFLGGAYLAYKGWLAGSSSSAGTTSQPSGGFPPWVLYVGVAAMLISMVWWLAWWAAPHRWIKLTITNKRSIRQEGIIMRKTSEVMHRHVTNVTIKQSFLHRIFGVGYIGIDAAGQGGEIEGSEDDPHRGSEIEIEVSHVPHPYRIKEIIDRYR